MFNYATDVWEDVKVNLSGTTAQTTLTFVRDLMAVKGQDGGKSKKSKSASKWTATGGTVTDKAGVTRNVYQNSKKAGQYVKKFVTQDGVKAAQYVRVKMN